MKHKHVSNERIRALVEQDVPYHEIARQLGCSRSCIDRRMRAMGLKASRSGPKSGARHPDWKGGTTIRKGYRYIYAPDHPHCVNGRYVAEHRLVMEQKLGRYLLRSEVVHHIDGNPLNNHPDNLAMFGANAEHLKHELTGRIPNWTDDGKQRILEGAAKGRELLRIRHQSKLDAQAEPQTTHQTEV